jgi:hypothetical protein
MDDLPSINDLFDGDFWHTGLWAMPQAKYINCDSKSHAQSHVVAILMD